MITYEMLKAKDACESQVSLFKELFPKGASLSVETAVSVADKFDWGWAARNLLSGSGYKAYQEAKKPLYKAYLEAVEPLDKAYLEAIEPLDKAYKEAVATLYKAYQEAKKPLYKAYKEAETPLYKAYLEAIATLFTKIYIKEQTT